MPFCNAHFLSSHGRCYKLGVRFALIEWRIAKKKITEDIGA
ncbi:hypothetical protein CP10139811_0898 [Chlamydia ibidis]|uniref:Uncharacterized protein n=2 Tax=Chlamydia ibidis TaxID=1405396 RepID=S7J316_9CHLA|nr:hypothetical protein CP10139811_0898 [Chlamydia ibidis]EQM63222.1 hypothetical protein H359_0217 [Chlamydia ibidis 10-1398/6]